MLRCRTDQHALGALTFLELWRTTKGDDASFENLINALETIGRNDLCKLAECQSPVALSPCNTRLSTNGGKPDGELNFDKVLTSEKQEGSSERDFTRENSALDNRKTINSKRGGEGVAVSRTENETDFDEDMIVVTKVESDRNQLQLHDLMNDLSGDEEFFDSVTEPSGLGIGGHNPSDEDERQTFILADEGAGEKAAPTRRVEDLCQEDEVEETLINDVRCSINADEFRFMKEDDQEISFVTSSKASAEEKCIRTAIAEEERDENSNLGFVPAESPVDNLANGVEVQKTSDELIKSMFADDKGVLDFFGSG